ncbi:MAG: type II secretion system protein GspM [Candidatus Methylomirabilia bacterium]
MLGRTLSERERRLLGLAGVAVPLILFWSYVADPFLTEQGSVRERLGQEERALNRSRELLVRKEKVAARRAELRDRLEVTRQQLLPGETPALAAAALQARLARAARGVGVSLASQRTERPIALGDFLEIPVHVRFQAPIDALARILKTIEASSLVLDVPELSIRVSDPKMPRDLEVEMVVSGFTLPSPSPSGEREG